MAFQSKNLQTPVYHTDFIRIYIDIQDVLNLKSLLKFILNESNIIF